LDCPGDTYILDAAEASGISLPYDCRLGSCVSCAGKVQAGTVDNSEQVFLNDDLMSQGFTLTCVAYPSSDCTITTDVQHEVNALF
jgi:ferredoxin